MKMIFKLMILFMCLSVLTSCTLAKVEGETQGDAKLVGVAVTMEYVDLFDMESYINDNINNLTDNGNLIVNENDTEKYGAALYAELVYETLTSDDGEETEYARYEFPLDNVIEMIAVDIGEDEYKSMSFQTGHGIESETNKLSYGEGEELELAGSIYVSSKVAGAEFYFNPVYQKPSGEVFLTSGSGFHFADDSQMPRDAGEIYSQTISESTTIESDGESVTYSADITVSIHAEQPAESFKFIQVSKNDEISVDEYDADRMPSEISLKADTSYIIFESVAAEESFSRKILDNKVDVLGYRILGDNGVFIAEYTDLIWE